MKLPLNKIIQGDCLEIMKEFPDNSIDTIITDPPYNIGGKSNKLTKVGSEIKSNYEVLGEWDNIENYFDWTRKWLIEAHRIVKGGVFSYFDLNEIGKLKEIVKEIGFYPKNFFIMVKNNPIPHIRKTGYRSGFEMGLMFMKDKKSKFNFLSQREMINVKRYNIGRKHTTHPTEKPQDIIGHFVKVLSDEGDIVLDPFVGSGTTCVMAKILKRNFIGIDISEDYCKIARERLRQNVLL